MFRLLLSIVAGSSVSFGLFYFMAMLISGGENRNADVSESIRVELLTAPPKSNVQTKRRVPPPPPPPPKAPPKAPEPEPDNDNMDSSTLQFNIPSVDVGGDTMSLTGPGSGIGRDGDATPIVRIEPKYPMTAQRNGTEGWVRLSFSINLVGGVEDVKVTEAMPKRVFDRAAKRALKRWKYKAKMVDGKPVKQTGLSVQLDFSMEQDEG
ncbi:MAG: protein TonB [Phenylobacterium sp.]|jgi:protein TonB